MSDVNPVPTSASTLLGMRVVDSAGHPCGRVTEFAVDLSRDATHIAGFVLGLRSKGKMRSTFLPVDQVLVPRRADKVLRTGSKPTTYTETDDLLLLDRDLLDQQIIDVDGRKVVRVNDVNLTWERADQSNEAKGLRIDEVEVGLRGASRRLLKGVSAQAVEAVSSKFPSRAIPWDFVDLIDRDPARRVRLRIEQDKLSRMHPSDIAAILEELAPAEREAIFTSLPEETAAETLEEVEPKMQKALLQGLDSERAADIIEEMDPGAAADLLSELSDEESEAILEEMEPEERQDVEDLLEFSANSAAGRMTTDFVGVALGATVADAIEVLRAFDGDADTITEIYLTGEEEHLKGVVALPRLLLAAPDRSLAELSEWRIVSCTLKASDNEVAELFDKYNLRSLPVVDHHGHIAGVIHAEQVIAQLREG
ncbi:magnesium transporter MgtE N-terminal domain-containing protein [Granulicella mallensis]|uniref:Sporulation protein YlmC with PRC-barrel domain/CBS domain-containing protein n=1 Tax=Granulicella mallensis TaxID=940614 RepID=A0A7W7ZTG3_9BACT|nr:CBS domain-containing protein [Granulicella mallensis]MBB5065472.1 sporulation protein YlmC with PRC-barrel domain/CBS domain-containing protein [Granulicella mallensis]